MRRWLADYEVESHLSIPGSSRLPYSHPKGLFEVHLKNLRTDPGTDTPLLSVQVILDAADAEVAARSSRDRLNFFLNTLTVVTNTRFAIHRIVRVVDWTPGLSERECVQFQGFAGAGLPIPGLELPLVETVRALHDTEISPRLRRALKWFARGVRSTNWDDQFQYFWFVLEVVAQLTKEPTPVPDLCPNCRSPLFCPRCSTTPTHRPFEKQAIEQLLGRTMGECSSDLFKTFRDVRNQLLHGEEIAGIERSIAPLSMAEVVDQIGNAAWVCLLYAFRATVDGTRDFLRVSSYTHKILSLKANMIIRLRGDSHSPRIEDLPTAAQISLITH